MTAHVRIGDPISCGDVVDQGSGNCFINGLPAARVGDLTAGHCYPPVPLLVGTPSVYFNGMLAAVTGNPIPTHTCDDNSHSGVVIAGSPNCYAGNTTASIKQGITLMSRYNQPNIPTGFAAEQHDDDQGSDPVYSSYRKSFGDHHPLMNIIDSEPIISKTTNAPVSSTCDDIYSFVGTFPGTFILSPHFNLSQLTTNTLVSNYPIQAQNGLIISDIICNLRQLCLNILEPLLVKYGSSLVINSGFRHGNGASQHYRGQAVDVSFKDIKTSDEAWDRAKELPSIVAFDQFIFEQNRSTWYHLSHVMGSNRSSTLTKPRGDKYYAGLIRLAA